jgi:succinylglutamate desuccinylase
MTDEPQPNPASAAFPRLHDIDYFNERLRAAVERVNAVRPYKMEILGIVGGRDIVLLTPAEMDPKLPNILSAGGFHGEESAGPWGIVEFLETADEATLKAVNHSFLPLVNPTGFAAASRLNIYGENPNRGFIIERPEIEAATTGNNRYPSKEGEILMQHFMRLLHLAREGFITQHEEPDSTEGFVFVNEDKAQPSPFGQALLDAMGRHFDLLDAEIEGKDSIKGLIHNDRDGSFEGLLMFWGIPRISTLETPGLQPANIRIAAQRDLTETFAKFSAHVPVAPPEPAVSEEDLSAEVDESTLPPVEKTPAEFPRLHDIDYFNERLRAALARVNAIRPYDVETLGAVGGHDILLLKPRDSDAAKPSILAAGGFHGEEPAGPWGIVEFLETADAETLKSVNYSFLPLVNPTGFIKAQRFNVYGENPNRGFLAIPPEIHQDFDNIYPSREGEVLIKHLPELLALAKDGFVSQHEDWRMRDGFVFVNENASMPSPFARTFLDTMARHFKPLDADGSNTGCKNGLWANDHDGSFESLLFAHGVPRISTFETPGRQPIMPRIEAQRDLTQAFADYTARAHTPQPKPAAGPGPNI